MVAVTRLDKQLMYLNPDHIICIEETPDTVITLFNGNRYIVIDRASTVISRIVAFRAKISRRAASRSAKKYLVRARSDQFRHDEHQTDTMLSGSTQGKHDHIPLHSRDY
jgi:flagellar protein FlbD